MTNEKPRLLMISGPNGSGKSSLITSSNIDHEYDSIINPDNYSRGLNIPDEYERYVTAMRLCSVLRDKLVESKVTFGFETVASRTDKLEFVKHAISKGYAFDLLFVNAGSPEECCSRIHERVLAGGHDVPREKVFSRYDRTLNLLHEFLALADTAKIFDNSGNKLCLILTKNNGEYSLSKNAKSIDWVEKYVLPYID